MEPARGEEPAGGAGATRRNGGTRESVTGGVAWSVGASTIFSSTGRGTYALGDEWTGGGGA